MFFIIVQIYFYKEKGEIFMPENSKLNIKKIDQVGFVVKDVEKTAEYYWTVLGIGPWSFFELGPGNKTTYHGEPCELLVKIAVAQVGPLMLELIQPVSGPTPHMDFLKTKGEGIQHLGIVVDGMEQVEEMKRLGYKELAGAYNIGGEDGFGVYFDAEKELGTTIELIRFSSQGAPCFDKIYPDPNE